MEKCKICDNYFKEMGNHLSKIHEMIVKDYVVLTEYNNIHPKCQCGYCDDDAVFNSRLKKFVKINKEHKKFEWIKEQKLKKCVPVCLTCGGEVNWTRGNPNKYCSFKCLPNRWNQDKVKQTIKEKYGVDNSFKIPEVKEKIQDSLAHMRKDMAIKCNETKKRRYKNGNFDSEKFKNTMMKNHGVENPSQIKKNRSDSSNRMKINNPMFDNENVIKNVDNHMKNIESGKTKLYNSIKYNDNLYYQSSYEKHFLDLCTEINIIDKIKNGHTYSYIENDKIFGHRILTDFTIDDIEIEIKSKWILEKQGGVSVIEAKRRSVESVGKKYMLILDKDYTEFLLQIIKNKDQI